MGDSAKHEATHGWLFRQSALVRTGVVWGLMLVILFSVFGVGILTHPNAWTDVAVREIAHGWPLLRQALINNSMILLTIGLGNLFVRFGWITPGLLILIIQAVSIGWTAGTNAFASPFPSVAAANATFLRIGLWETGAYAIVCAVTLTKARLVADTFPAREWVMQRSLRDLKFTRIEVLLLILSVVMLVGAASVEAWWA